LLIGTDDELDVWQVESSVLDLLGVLEGQELVEDLVLVADRNPGGGHVVPAQSQAPGGQGHRVGYEDAAYEQFDRFDGVPVVLGFGQFVGEAVQVDLLVADEVHSVLSLAVEHHPLEEINTNQQLILLVSKPVERLLPLMLIYVDLAQSVNHLIGYLFSSVREVKPLVVLIERDGKAAHGNDGLEVGFLQKDQ